jgi:multidrug efflux system outer membrane protein
MKKTLTIILFTAVFLAACTSPVDKQDSKIVTPVAWNNFSDSFAASKDQKIEHDWWKHFGDPTLDAILAEALANNKNLEIAKERIEEARANRGIAKSALYPQISGVAQANRGNQGYATTDKTLNFSQVDVEASWEVDLFGRNQANVANAKAILQSTEATKQAVTVALLAEVARNYFDLRNYEHQIEITEKNLDTQKQTLNLIKSQFEGLTISISC